MTFRILRLPTFGGAPAIGGSPTSVRAAFSGRKIFWQCPESRLQPGIIVVLKPAKASIPKIWQKLIAVQPDIIVQSTLQVGKNIRQMLESPGLLALDLILC